MINLEDDINQMFKYAYDLELLGRKVSSSVKRFGESYCMDFNETLSPIHMATSYAIEICNDRWQEA